MKLTTLGNRYLDHACIATESLWKCHQAGERPRVPERGSPAVAAKQTHRSGASLTAPTQLTTTPNSQLRTESLLQRIFAHSPSNLSPRKNQDGRRKEQVHGHSPNLQRAEEPPYYLLVIGAHLP